MKGTNIRDTLDDDDGDGSDGGDCSDGNDGGDCSDDIILVPGSFFLLLLSEVPLHLFHFHHGDLQATNQI